MSVAPICIQEEARKRCRPSENSVSQAAGKRALSACEIRPLKIQKRQKQKCAPKGNISSRFCAKQCARPSLRLDPAFWSNRWGCTQPIPWASLPFAASAYRQFHRFTRLAAGAKEIRTADPILVFIDRRGRFETNTDGTALVDIGAFAGDPPHDPRGQYRRHRSSLETLSALVLTDHAYDKLTDGRM